MSIRNLKQNEDFTLAVARNDISDANNVHKYGFNEGVGTSWETIWEQGGAVTFVTTAAVVGIPSGSQSASNDGVKITVEGLDENYNEQSEEITLDSSGDATSTNTFIRVNRAFVSGSTALAADVDIEIGTTTVAHVDADHQQTLQNIYTVPAGKTAYVKKVHCSTATKNKEVKIRIWAREDGGVFRTRDIFGIFQEAFEKDFDYSLSFGEKTDIQIQGLAESNNTKVSAGFDMVIVG